ncbi:unnamed protein product [Coregonus sp. 'balchen']|nr:unnamed protein product [Coregonus sp. 'balchen']
MSRSLTTLDFESKGIVILRHKNYSDTNGAILELPYFNHLQFLIFSFPNAHNLSKGAFRSFENISSLDLPDIGELQTQLLQSGISRIYMISFESICEIFNDTNINNYITSEKSLFGLHSLETLLLYDNPLIHIEASAFIHLILLKEVNLDFRPPTSELETSVNLTHLFGVFPQGLTHMNISSWCPLTIIIVSDRAPKPGFALKLSSPSTVIFQDCWRSLFRSVVFLNVMIGRLLCCSDFFEWYSTSLQEIEFRLVSSTEFGHVAPHTDMTDLNTLVQRDLKLMNVDLIHWAACFHNLTRLESLSLIYCRILPLGEELSRDLHFLRLLYVDVTEEFSVMEKFSEPQTSLRYVKFYYPRLHCSCENAWLENWARGQRQIQVIIWHAVELAITWHPELPQEANCSLDMGFFLFICTSLSLLLFIILVLLNQLAGDNLLALCHIARGWMEEAVRRPNPRERYRYDAF